MTQHTEQQIREAVEKMLRDRLDQVPAPDTDWNELGMDSLEVIDLFLKLEEALDTDIPVENFAMELSTDTLVSFILEQQRD